MEAISAIINPLIMSLLISGLVCLYTASNLLESSCVEASCQATRESFNMALIARGIDPHMIQTGFDKCQSNPADRKSVV